MPRLAILALWLTGGGGFAGCMAIEAGETQEASGCGPVCESLATKQPDRTVQVHNGEETLVMLPPGALHKLGVEHTLRDGGMVAVQLQVEATCWIDQESVRNPLDGQTYYNAVAHIYGRRAGTCRFVFLNPPQATQPWRGTLLVKLE